MSISLEPFQLLRVTRFFDPSSQNCSLSEFFLACDEEGASILTSFSFSEEESTSESVLFRLLSPMAGMVQARLRSQKMETRVNIRKLIDDLQSFKNCVRAMQNSADQQEALTALDLITADDRSLQQAISVGKVHILVSVFYLLEIANQTMLNDLINATKRIEDLQEERLNFANTIAAKLFELEEDIRNDHQRLSRFKARLGSKLSYYIK